MANLPRGCLNGVLRYGEQPRRCIRMASYQKAAEKPVVERRSDLDLRHAQRTRIQMRYELLLQRVSRLDVCELVENDGRQQLHWNTVRRSALLQLVLIFAQLSDVPLTAAPGSVFHLLHQGVAE